MKKKGQRKTRAFEWLHLQMLKSCIVDVDDMGIMNAIWIVPSLIVCSSSMWHLHKPFCFRTYFQTIKNNLLFTFNRNITCRPRGQIYWFVTCVAVKSFACLNCQASNAYFLISCLRVPGHGGLCCSYICNMPNKLLFSFISDI